MATTMKQTILAAMTLLLLTGCVSSLTGGTMTAAPIADSSGPLSPEDSAIATAVAVQTATGPRQRYANVDFGRTQGISLDWLAREKFEFTGVKLYISTPPQGGSPGQSMGEIELTDPLGRKALFLYDATYRRQGGRITLTALKVIENYVDVPRMDFSIVRASDLPAEPIRDYPGLIKFLADKAVSPAQYRTLGGQRFVFFAVSRDWGGPEAKLNIAVSASKTGLTGYSKETVFCPVKGMWPVAMAMGTLDPANADKPLYAKVTYRPRGGFTATELLGVYQVAAFGK